jgi:hypothetical protein
MTGCGSSATQPAAATPVVADTEIFEPEIAAGLVTVFEDAQSR